MDRVSRAAAGMGMLILVACCAPVARAETVAVSTQGPTPMRHLADGLPAIDVESFGVDASRIVTDYDRYISWPSPANGGSALLDTKTLSIRAPRCPLTAAYRAVFVTSCGPPEAPSAPTLYYAATGRRRALPGAEGGDVFDKMGHEWLAGLNVLSCNSEHCLNDRVWVNWRTGQRHVERNGGSGRTYDLNGRRLLPQRRHSPGELRLDWRLGHPLILDQRRHRPVVLARHASSGVAPDVCVHVCRAWLLGRHVSWADDNDNRTPAGALHGYDVDARRRSTWTFRFTGPAPPTCTRTDTPYILSFNTRYAILAFAVSDETAYTDKPTCEPHSFSLFAARWPGAPHKRKASEGPSLTSANGTTGDGARHHLVRVERG